MSHTFTGNCWEKIQSADDENTCRRHGEPRGICSRCPRCPDCDAAHKKLKDPRTKTRPLNDPRTKLLGRNAWLRDLCCAPCRILALSRRPGYVVVEWTDSDRYHEEGDVSVVKVTELAVT
jgi:hypothetical protein